MNLEFNDRACPLCGSHQAARVVESNIDPAKLTEFAFASRKFPEYMHHRMVECASCEMFYANPVFSPEVIAKAYLKAAFDSQRESYFASLTYRSLLRRRLEHLPAKEAALDIGAGDGSFLEQLVSLGFKEAVGVEPSEAPIAAAKPNIRSMIRKGLFRAQDFGRQSFDLVTCFQVMEHLSDPLLLTRDAFSLLKPGGMFFAVVHDLRALSARLLGAKSPIFDIEHLQLFTGRTIISLFQRAGFQSVSGEPVWNRYPLHYWMKLFPLPRGLKESAISAAKLTRIGCIPLGLPAGNLAVIGYKPKLNQHGPPNDGS